LANPCTLIEKERILTAACREADKNFTRIPQGHKPEADTVPKNELNWD
jgi:hypothetical protein